MRSDDLICLGTFPASLFDDEPDLYSFVEGCFRHSRQRSRALETEERHRKKLDECEEVGRAREKRLFTWYVCEEIISPWYRLATVKGMNFLKKCFHN